jgi:5-methylphenazine-1-carboxylate 1-monooxygenase
MDVARTDIAIVGGGITGLSLALNLHKHGMRCRVFERAPEIRELGVGITLLPHAMREFAAFGLEEELVRAGVPIRESCFFNRFGQLIYREDRGRHAGYPFPEVSIHRGRLHMILLRAAIDRLGAPAIILNRDCVAVEQDDAGVTLRLRETTSGAALDGVRADVAIACDGVNSALRRQFYPDDAVAFAGINTWRGITRRKPFLTGRSYTRTGSILTGKIVIYPIIDNVDGEGNQLINWMAEIKQDTFEKNDWNQRGDLADFFDLYRDWHFDWLDVADLIRTADQILEYPMVDKDPVARWTFGRVTLAGDAAHPMYPRGSNGAAQGAIDARTLAVASRPAAPPVATRARRCGTTKAGASVRPRRWSAPTAPIRRISSTSRSRSWSATGRSTTSTSTSPRTSCGRCRRTTSGSRDFRCPTSRPEAGV